MSLVWQHPFDKVHLYYEPIAPTVVEFDYEPTEPVGTLLDRHGETLRTVYPPTSKRHRCGFAPSSPSPTQEHHQ
jgi:hypothetical protein